MRIALVLLVAAACHEDEQVSNGKAEPNVEPTQQGATAVEHAESEQQGYVGVLAPKESVEVFAPFTSSVAELKVKMGDRVEHGQPLARLDDRPLREQLAIADATLRASQAEVAQSDVERRSAASSLERERKAFKENVVSQADVSAAEFTSRKAEMAVARAGASVQEQRAKIAALKARLVDTMLLAPLAGRVALIYVQDGARVEEGHPVIRVISSDELFVKFAVPAEKLGTVKPGDPVDISIEQQGIHTQGVIRHVSPELDPVAQMILADAELTEPVDKLQSGIVCRIIPKAAATPAPPKP